MSTDCNSDSIGHSEEYFGDYRNYWYNYDFLELMAKRWELQNVSSLLDVGCGQCHWSRILSPFLSPNTKIVGVDNDPKWSKEDDKIKKEFIKNSIDFSLLKAEACSLPFPDNSFDAVTCQTVLIHIENPLEALAEMKRVLKPGGILICAEPNNIASALIKNSLSKNDSIEQIIEDVTFALVKEKGKIKFKKGDNSLGDLVNGLMHQSGLKNIKSYISDKTIPILPPYKTKETEAIIDQILSNDYQDHMENETETQFEVFEGKYDDILNSVNAKRKNAEEKLKRSIINKEYYDGGGFLMYLISGRK